MRHGARLHSEWDDRCHRLTRAAAKAVAVAVAVAMVVAVAVALRVPRLGILKISREGEVMQAVVVAMMAGLDCLPWVAEAQWRVGRVWIAAGLEGKVRLWQRRRVNILA